MEKRLPSGITQKTTSKIALIALAAATMMITLSIIGAIQLQEASAAPKHVYCYQSGSVADCTFISMKDCREAQSSDDSATSKCRPSQTR
jgi:basic membrane lipoprotein Med (substrate-binding protein (PBP1-ABC) superfamily)